MKRIYIVGAGFAGFLTAKYLSKRLGSEVEVTLIDPKDHFLFAPLLIDVLQGDIKPDEITIHLPTAAQKFGFRFVQGRVTEVDRSKKMVLIDRGDGPSPTPYDILVLAQGAQTNYYGNVTAEKHAFPLKTLKDAARLYSRIEWCVREASSIADPTKRRSLLTFAVVGAGATGIEALCSMQRLAYSAATAFPELKKEMQFHLFQATSQILPGFPLRLVRFAMRECERRGFFVHCDTPVTAVTETMISGKDWQYETSCVLWSAGLAPNLVPAEPEMAKAGPWLAVDSFLRVEDSVFAAGDIVSFTYQKLIVPKNAQTAKMMATVLTENVVRTLQGRKDLKGFTYFSKGTLLVMGHQGYADFRFFGLPGHWVGRLREFFYRFTLWQMSR